MKPKLKKKAYSYRRVSSGIQATKGEGLERQQERIDKWLKANPDYELDESLSFTDKGKSGYKAAHLDSDSGGGLGLFLDAVAAKKVARGSVLLIEAWDRWSRIPAYQAIGEMSPVIQSGITIVTLVDGVTHNTETLNDIGVLLKSVLAMHLAHEESKRKSDLISSAWEKKRLKASEHQHILSKMIPAWIDVDEEKTGFVINKGKAEIVAMIFNWRLEGKPIGQITSDLNGMIPNISNRSDVWSRAGVKALLTNKAVIGTLEKSQHHKKKERDAVAKGEVYTGFISEDIPNYYPTTFENGKPFVSPELFLKVQKLMEMNKGRATNIRRFPYAVNLFRGLVKCHFCGATCSVQAVTHNYKGTLRCTNSLMHGCKDSHGERTAGMSMRKFETALIPSLLPLLTEENTETNTLIATLEIELKAVNKTVENLVNAISEMGMSKPLHDRYQENLAKQTKLEKQLAKERLLVDANKDICAIFELNLEDSFEDRSKANAMLGMVIEKIVFDGEKRSAQIILRNGNVILNTDLNHQGIYSPIVTGYVTSGELNQILDEESVTVVMATQPRRTKAQKKEDLKIESEQPNFDGWPEPHDPDEQD